MIYKVNGFVVIAFVRIGAMCSRMVPEERIELTRCYHHQILSLARLPVPPLRQSEEDYTKLILKSKIVSGHPI